MLPCHASFWDFFLFQSLDATLYLIQSVAEYVEPNEESFIPAILSLLPRLPAHSYVSQTALLMVGMCVCEVYLQ